MPHYITWFSDANLRGEVIIPSQNKSVNVGNLIEENQRPRKILNFETPADNLGEVVALTD